MNLPHLKFVWGGPEVIHGRWYFRLIGFYGRTEGAHDDGLAINVRGLLPWMLALAAALWLAGAGALWWVWQRNPRSLLTYSDALLYPLRRAEIHDKRGQALIAQGTAALRAKRWGEALVCLRQGQALRPRDGRTRLALAQFYVATNQQPAALRLLQEGLTEQFPGQEYLAGLFVIAEQSGDFGVMVQTAERYRHALPAGANPPERRWLLAQEFSARMGARQFAEALALAETEEPGDTASEHRVMALLELHRPEEALRWLASWRAQPGADVKVVSWLSVRALREARQFDQLEGALAELRKQAPADPQPHVYAVVQQALTGREAPARAALEDYLFRFGASPQNLQLVAEPLAEIGNLPLLERCATAADERGYAAQPFQSLLVHAHVQRGEWAVASRVMREMKPVAGDAPAQEQLWRDWMRLLLDAVQEPGDAAAPQLEEFLRGQPWPVRVFQITVEALRQAKQPAAALEVLDIAQAKFPANAWVGTQETAVRRELAARPSSPPRPVVAKASLFGQGPYFQRLDELLRSKRWTAAEQLLRKARSAQPEPNWLSSRDGELRLAEMRVAQALGEQPRMLAAAVLYLNGDAARSAQALDLARAFFAAGDRDSAIALVNKVMRRSPNTAAAQELLVAWRPEPTPPK